MFKSRRQFIAFLAVYLPLMIVVACLGENHTATKYNAAFLKRQQRLVIDRALPHAWIDYNLDSDLHVWEPEYCIAGAYGVAEVPDGIHWLSPPNWDGVVCYDDPFEGYRLPAYRLNGAT